MIPDVPFGGPDIPDGMGLMWFMLFSGLALFVLCMLLEAADRARKFVARRLCSRPRPTCPVARVAPVPPDADC